MYRPVPRNALFQGDVLIVPEIAMRDPDPRLVTSEPRKALVCPTCLKEIPEPRNCPDPDCQAQLKRPKLLVRKTSIRDRQKANENPFAEKLETLARFASRMAIVASCSCDIDQQGEIIFLGVRPLTSLSAQMQANLRAGRQINNLMYLPPVGRLAPAAVELNVHFSLPRSWFGEQRKYPSPKKRGADENALIPFAEVTDQRLASLSRPGIEQFYRAQIRHITRSPNLVVTLPADFQLEEIETDRLDPDPAPRRGWTLPDPDGVVARN